jgi:hypothetical protein
VTCHLSYHTSYYPDLKSPSSALTKAKSEKVDYKMSSRAIRALRGDVALSDIPLTVAEDGNSDDESEEDVEHRRRPLAFAMMDDDDDSSSSDKDEEDEVDASKESKDDDGAIQRATNLNLDEAQERVDEEEDLDALLIEFQVKDNTQPLLSGQIEAVRFGASPFDLILASFDARDLDYEYSMRTSMMSSGRESTSSSHQQRPRKASLFGPPGNGWIRPPRLVGGGIGMTTYDADPTRLLPWPYHTDGISTLASQWCTFVHSDTYNRNIQEYSNVIQQSGDLDALVMFVAHHPYVTAALLQLATVLYQTNHSQEGLALLRRCLWVFESSALPVFINQIFGGKVCLMDNDQPENAVFFRSLFRLMQVSHIAG